MIDLRIGFATESSAALLLLSCVLLLGGTAGTLSAAGAGEQAEHTAARAGDAAVSTSRAADTGPGADNIDDRKNYPWWSGHYRPGNVVVFAGVSAGHLSGFGVRPAAGIEVLAGTAGGGDRLQVDFGVETAVEGLLGWADSLLSGATGVTLSGVMHFGFRGLSDDDTRDLPGLFTPYLKAGVGTRFGLQEYRPPIVNLAFGAGLDLFLTDHLQLRIGYEHIGNFDEYSFDGATVGVGLKIGRPRRIWPKEYWSVHSIGTDIAVKTVERIDRYYRAAFSPGGVRPIAGILTEGDRTTWEIRFDSSTASATALVSIAVPQQTGERQGWRQVIITDEWDYNQIYEFELDDSGGIKTLRYRITESGPIYEWRPDVPYEWPTSYSPLEIDDYLPYVTERTVVSGVAGTFQVDRVSIPPAAEWLVNPAVPGGLLGVRGTDGEGTPFESTLLTVDGCGGSELRSF
jgi:hypothetical protein